MRQKREKEQKKRGKNDDGGLLTLPRRVLILQIYYGYLANNRGTFARRVTGYRFALNVATYARLLQARFLYFALCRAGVIYRNGAPFLYRDVLYRRATLSPFPFCPLDLAFPCFRRRR